MKMGERRHDLDWLRTLASYLVIVYHTAQFFDFQEKTYIKNGELSWAVDIFTRVVHIWHMPLFFLLAGWSVKASLRRRGAWGFVLERARRLLIPLLFGLCCWCAFPRWVELKHGLFRTSSGERLSAQPTISLATFLRQYYYSGGGVSWGHLWFLAYLFTFSALYLPGLLVLSKIGFAEKWLHGWGGWALANAPVLPLVLIQFSLRDRWPGFQNLFDDWANFWFYSTFFVTGFCLAQFPVLEAHLVAGSKVNLVMGILSSFLCLLSSPSFGSYPLSSYNHLFSALGAWYTVLSFLAGGRYAFSGRAAPPFWADLAFPVYVVHDVPLALLAEGLLPSSGAPVVVKFVILASSDLILSLLLLRTYFSLLTLLFGPKKELESVPTPQKVD